MLLIVERARGPVHVTEALCPYESSGIGKGAAGKVARKETVARLVAKGSVSAERPPARTAAEQGMDSDTGSRQ